MSKKKIKLITSDTTINVALDTLAIGKQALVFTNTKRSAEKTAEDIAKKINTSSLELASLAEQVLHALSKPTKQCERLAFCLRKGVVYHHAGLVHKQRDIIEENFRKGLIKIICATPTLAFGIDLPAFRAILKSLKRFGSKGLQYIPVLDYLQMAGRAGRPSYDKFGEAICIAETESEAKELTKRYLKGKPEDIFSKLAVEPVLRTYILSLIATNFFSTKAEIISFFDKTFWAFQFGDMKELEQKIMKMLQLLEEWEFIRSNGGEFSSADELEEEKYKATVIGKRIAELYIDPLTAYNFIVALRRGTGKLVVPFSFLQMISQTNELRPLLRVRMKEQDIIQEHLLKYGDNIIMLEPSIYEPEYEDFLNSVKTAMFFSDWMDEKEEEYLLETYNIRPGETRVKLDRGDWLLYTVEELSRIMSFKDYLREIKKLRMRLKYGVKEELLPLLQFEQIGRVRARIMFKNGIKDVKDVKKADVVKLVQLLGSKIAAIVKKQVGQEVKIVKEQKRKGQISLRDY